MAFISLVSNKYKVVGQSYTYGVFPPYYDFRRAFETKLCDQYYWNLKGEAADAVEKLGYGVTELWEDPTEFYKDLKYIYKRGNDVAKDIVSGIITQMGFEWV